MTLPSLTRSTLAYPLRRPEMVRFRRRWRTCATTRVGRRNSRTHDSGIHSGLHRVHGARADGGLWGDHAVELSHGGFHGKGWPGARVRQYPCSEAGRGDSVVRALAQALCMEAGIPPGVINVVPGYGDIAGAALSSHPLVAKSASRAAPKSVARSSMRQRTISSGSRLSSVVSRRTCCSQMQTSTERSRVHCGRSSVTPGRIASRVHDSMSNKRFTKTRSPS